METGVSEGVTTGTIASILETDAVLYAIDPFVKGRTGICWGFRSLSEKFQSTAPNVGLKWSALSAPRPVSGSRAILTSYL